MRSRPFKITIVLLIATSGTALLILSPLAFTLLDYSVADWSQLANIGQAYGAISALVSAIALAGVVGSLIVQQRQSAIARAATNRQQHWMLLKMAMEDHALLECWGGSPIVSNNTKRSRQMMYTNMILTHWDFCWKTGSLTEATMRQHISNLFESEPSRAFWGAVREFRVRTYVGGEIAAFDEIAEEEYRRVLGQVTASNAAAETEPHPT